MADIKLIIDVDDDGKIQKATDSLEKLEVAAKKTGANASDMATAFSPSGNLQRNTFSFKDTVDDTTGSLGMMFEQMAGGAAPQDAFIDFVAGLGGSLGPIGAIMIPAVTAGLVALGPKIIEHTGLFKDFGASVEQAASSIDSVVSSFENYQSLTGGDVDLGREVSSFAQRSLQVDVAMASKQATKVMSELESHFKTLVNRYVTSGAETHRGPEEKARLEAMQTALKYLSEVDEVDTSSVKDMVDTLKTVNVILEQQVEGSLKLDQKKIDKLREFGDSITEFLASVEMNQAKLDAALGYGVDESATVARDRSGLVRRRNGKTAKDPLKEWFEAQGIRSAPFITAPRYGGDFAANEFWASHGASSDDWKERRREDLVQLGADQLKAFFESQGIRSAPFISAPRYGGNFAANEFWASHGASSDDWKERRREDLVQLGADQLKAFFESQGIRSAPFISAPRYGGNFAANEFWASHDAPSDDYVTKGYSKLDETLGDIYTLWADLKPMMEDRFYGDKERPEMTPELEEKLYGLLENQWETVSDVLVRQGSLEEIYQAYASTQDTILDELVEMGQTEDDIYTLWADLKPMLEDRFYGDRERPLMTPELEEELHGLIENQWEMVSDVMVRQGSLEEMYQAYASTQDSILDALIELEETNDKSTEVEEDLKVAQEANTEALNANAELLRDFFKSQGVDIRPFSTAPRYGGDFGRNDFWATHDYPEEEFAVGGVVNRATRFGMSNGGRGVMGEAGPEAILPLRRGADGKLGVAMNGGGGVVIHQSFNFSANGDDSVKKIIASEAPKIAKITERSIINSRQRGGSIRKVFG